MPEDVRVAPFDSLFEQRVFNRLDRPRLHRHPAVPGRRATTSTSSSSARKARLAIECDGDTWHGPDVYERDLARQRDLERCGWQFFRVRESAFYLDPAKAMTPVWERLAEREIHPSGWAEHDLPQLDEGTQPHDGDIDLPAGRTVVVPDFETEDAQDDEDVAMPQHDVPVERTDDVPTPVAVEPVAATPPAAVGALAPYETYFGSAPSLITATRAEIVDVLVAIVAVEGPILGHRLHSVYIKAAAGQRVSQQAAKVLNSAVSAAVRQGRLVQQDPLGESGVKPRTFRLPDQPQVVARQLGPRTFDQVPPAELAHVMRETASNVGWEDLDTVFRETMARFGLRRMGSTVRARLQAAVALARTADDLVGPA